MFFLKTIRWKVLLAVLIPTIFVLPAVFIILNYTFDRIAQDVVKQRDAELARISAARVSESLIRFTKVLEGSLHWADVRSMNPERLNSALGKAKDMLNVFDAGIMVYNSEGDIIWYKSSTAGVEKKKFPVLDVLATIYSTLRPAFSNVFQDPVSGEDIILIGLPIMGKDKEIKGILAGICTIKYSIFWAKISEILEIKAGHDGYAYLVDGNGRVIYHRYSSQLGIDLATTLPVMLLKKGSGAVLVDDPKVGRVVSGFAPVLVTGWGVITHEKWENIILPVRRNNAMIMGFLLLGGVLSGTLILLIIGSILKPIKDLAFGVQRISEGNFDYLVSPKTGDEIETLAMQYNTMAIALKSSFSEMEKSLEKQKLAEEELQKHQQQLEKIVEERTAALKAANRELEAFTYSVSHDLRAPLRAIEGFTQMLVRHHGADFDDEGKRVCSVIVESTKKMSSLIDDLLALSRLGRTEMHFTSIDMKTMAGEVFAELTTPEMQQRIDFALGDLPSATGDPALLRQVWTNLISNAVKFSAHRERASISVTSSKEEGKAVYCIQDNGAGFNMKYQNKLFGVFQRLHSEKDFEGTGVGLAIVQRIIHRHGGEVWAKGEVDKGAEFCFSLPIKEGNSH